MNPLRAACVGSLLVLSAAIGAQAPREGGPRTVWRRASDVDAAAAHLETLGLRVQRREAGRVVLVAPGSALAVVVASTAPPRTGGVSDPLEEQRPLVLPVADIAAEKRRLRQANLRFAVLVARPSGAESLRVTDADGNATLLRLPRDASPATVAIPGPGALNDIVLEVLQRYPHDGTHTYHWPRTGSWQGCTKDLEYGGTVFSKGDSKGRCYCCGLTFEVLLDAWRLWCARNGRTWRIAQLDLAGVRRLQTQWFGSAEDKSCLHTALVANGLGFRILDPNKARPGDFVQLWRQNGSGHSVVFLAWLREDGEIVGMRYWSTQPATNGIGERTEWFDERAGKHRVLRDPLWICRVGDPN